MTNTNSNRRLGWTRFFVPDPAFGWYMRTVTAAAVATATAFAGLLWWYHGHLLDVLGLYDVLDDPAAHHLVVEYSKLSLVVILLGVMGAASFVLMISLFLLYRIAGPIYRLKAHMMDLMDGASPRPLRFRENDQLADLAEIFNDFQSHAGILPRSGSPGTQPSSEAAQAPGDASEPQRA